ncbi:MAG: PhzF family phenazine biosynthesis protein [Pseudomonadota bacterium]
MTTPFQIVDVFSPRAFAGNPVAVVFADASLGTDTMQRITRWLNLSETCFVLPTTEPKADYRVRIFTLERELPFAGHPTLGTAHAWLRAGGVPQSEDEIVQECGAGLVRLRRSPQGRLSFAAPPLERSGPLDPTKLAEIAGVLGIVQDAIVDAAWCDNGPGWAGILLPSAEDVLALKPASAHPTRIDIGVVGPYTADELAAVELREFFSDHTGALREDPVTGSLNASIAQWLVGSGRLEAPYLASQGTALGCEGRIHIEADATEQLWVGGETHTRFEGETHLA